MKKESTDIKFQIFISNDRVVTVGGDKVDIDNVGNLSILKDGEKVFYAPIYQWQCYLLGDLSIVMR
jgi:hypothetical protein